MIRPLPALLGVALLSGSVLATAQEPTNTGRVLAEVKGVAITEEQIAKAAAGDLMNIALQRQRILETQLERVINARVIELEAESRKLTDVELLQREVYGKVVEPSLDDVTAYYEASKDLMKEAADKAVPRIRQTLISQRRQKAYKQFVDELRAKYNVKVLLQPVRLDVDAQGYPSRGPATAPVTIVLFSDFECPYCRTMATTLEQATREYGAKVRLVFRQFPLAQIHPNAVKAAEASLCANDQGRFWEMHDVMFIGGERLVPTELSLRAKTIGLDMAAFETCMASGKHAGRIKNEIDAGRALGVSSTPTMFVNGRPIRGAIQYPELSKMIQEELSAKAGKSGPF